MGTGDAIATSLCLALDRLALCLGHVSYVLLDDQHFDFLTSGGGCL